MWCHSCIMYSFLLPSMMFFFLFHFFFLMCGFCFFFFFFSSRRRHTRCLSDWSSDVCSSDLGSSPGPAASVPFFAFEQPAARPAASARNRIDRIRVSGRMCGMGEGPSRGGHPLDVGRGDESVLNRKSVV